MTKHNLLGLAGLVGAATLGFGAAPAAAQDRYIGEIIYAGYTFCPRGTADTSGQILPISSNTALFSLIGTTFGGDGRTTFALPNLQGRAALHQGNGPGVPSVTWGQTGGAQDVTLSTANLPSHSHDVRANNLDGDKPGPGGKLLAAAPPSGTGSETIYSDQGATVTMSAQMIAPTGGSAAVPVEDPYETVRFCIVTQGIFPSRS